MLGISLAEQVVDPGADLEVLVDAVCRVQREHAEAATLVVVLADHVAFVWIDTVLRRDHPPQRTSAPIVFAVGQAQARVQRWHLWQGLAVAAVLAPGIGEAGVGFPVLAQLVRCAHFAAHDTCVHIARLGGGAHHAGPVVKQDEVAHLADIARHPGFQVGALVLGTEVELSGFLGLHAVEGIHRAGRAGVGGEQFPVIRETFRVAQAGIQRGGAVRQVVLITHKARGQCIGAGVAGGRVRARHHSRAGALTEVLGRGAVQARAGDQAIVVGGVPGQFAEHTVVVEIGVLVARQILIRVDAHAAARTVFIGLRI